MRKPRSQQVGARARRSNHGEDACSSAGMYRAGASLLLPIARKSVSAVAKRTRFYFCNYRFVAVINHCIIKNNVFVMQFTPLNPEILLIDCTLAMERCARDRATRRRNELDCATRLLLRQTVSAYGAIHSADSEQ